MSSARAPRPELIALLRRAAENPGAVPALRLSRPGLTTILTSPHLAGVRTLRLDAMQLTDDVARAIADSPALAGLKRLELGGNRVGDEGVTALARSAHLEGLESLDL